MCFSPTGLISRAAASEKRLAAPLCHFWPPFTAAGGGGGGRQQQVMTVGLDQDQVSLLGVITPQSLARSLICSNKDLFQDCRMCFLFCPQQGGGAESGLFTLL